MSVEGPVFHMSTSLSPLSKGMIVGGIGGVVIAVTLVALGIIYRRDVSQFFGTTVKQAFEAKVQPFFTHTLKNFFEKQFVPFFKNTIPTTAKNLGQVLSAHKAAVIANGVSFAVGVLVGGICTALVGRKVHLYLITKDVGDLQDDSP